MNASSTLAAAPECSASRRKLRPLACRFAALPAVCSKRRRVERDDVRLGLRAATAEQRAQPLGILLGLAAGDDLQRRAFEAGVLRCELELSDMAPFDRRTAARLAVQRDFVEARAVDDQRLLRRPCASSVCAIRRSILGSATPSNWTGGLAGLMHGPSRFMTVRTASCRRTSAGMLHARMVGGREQEAEAGLVEQLPRGRRAAGRCFAPSASSTSAEPQRELTVRLPCLAIGSPRRRRRRPSRSRR